MNNIFIPLGHKLKKKKSNGFEFMPCGDVHLWLSLQI